MEIIADALYETAAVVDNGPILRPTAIGGLIWRQQAASIVTRGEEEVAAADRLHEI